MLKSAKKGNLFRVTVRSRKVVTLTRVLCPFYREVKVGGWCRFPMWDFVQVTAVSGVSAGAWHLGRVSSFGRGEGVFALVLVVLRLDMIG
ncbi:unnamed protein product [Prunus armeniaca]